MPKRSPPSSAPSSSTPTTRMPTISWPSCWATWGDTRTRGPRRSAIQLNPPLARAQTNLSLERYNAERKSQERRQRLAPEPQVVEGNELAHYNLGLAFRQKGYYNEALREYRLALERGED